MARHYRKKPARMLGIGPRVHACRKQAQLSQQALAALVGCTPNTIHFLETGLVHDPHVSLILECARTFGVTTDYLLGLT